MFRLALSAVRSIRPLTVSYFNGAPIINAYKNFSSHNHVLNNLNLIGRHVQYKPISSINNEQVLKIFNNITVVPSRNVTKFSLNKGKRKTVKAALRRFFRLDWGGWIRPKVGRHKKMWKKSPPQKRRLRQHVFCNSTQCTMLDKMVTKFWKRPKYYVDDPYAPYHTREEFAITRTKPVFRN